VRQLNLIEVYNKLADDVAILIDNKIKNINRDFTFKARVTAKISDGKYKILHKNVGYTVRGSSSTNIDDWVYVCAPGNDWNELFITYNITGGK